MKNRRIYDDIKEEALIVCDFCDCHNIKQSPQKERVA